jgi:hypothetical protein
MPEIGERKRGFDVSEARGIICAVQPVERVMSKALRRCFGYGALALATYLVLLFLTSLVPPPLDGRQVAGVPSGIPSMSAAERLRGQATLLTGRSVAPGAL